jgi:hypothetical protein
VYEHPDTLRAVIRFREQDCRDRAATARLARLATRRLPRAQRRALTAPTLPNPATGTGCGLPTCPFATAN